MDHADWPPLDLSDWEPTYLTLHRFAQIVGKVRMARTPRLNHWWNVPLYVSVEGLTTSPIPAERGLFELSLDFRQHRLLARSSNGIAEGFPLMNLSVAEFYERTRDLLRRIDADTEIWPVPVEVADTTPFPDDHRHATYDPAQVERLHRILMSISRVFWEHRGRFLGKSSPVHFFWGAFDLAVTRFSGRPNPKPPADRVMGAAYSHEVLSHGFWPGGDWPGAGRVDEALFYAYALPEPAGFRDEELAGGGHYDATLGEFVLPYDEVRTAADPRRALLSFMEQTYQAGARRAGWPIEELEAPSLRAPAPEGDELPAPLATPSAPPHGAATPR